MFHLRALKDNITQWKLEFKNFKGDMYLGLDLVIDSPSVRTTSQLNFFPRIVLVTGILDFKIFFYLFHLRQTHSLFWLFIACSLEFCE